MAIYGMCGSRPSSGEGARCTREAGHSSPWHRDVDLEMVWRVGEAAVPEGSVRWW